MRRLSIFSVFVLLAAATAGGAERDVARDAQTPHDPRVVITLLPSATVPEATVRLDDVATLRGGDEGERARYGALSLGLAPPAGGESVLSRGHVTEILLREGATPETVFLGGSLAVRVRLATRLLRGAELAAAGRAELVAALDRVAQGLGRFEIELSAPAPDVLVPAGRRGVRVEHRVRRAELRSGTHYVDARVEVDGRFVRQVPLAFDTRWIADVLTVTRPVARDEAVGPHNLALEETEVRDASGARPLTSLRDVEGRLARRPLRPGDVVTARSVYRPFTVHRGDPVLLVLRDGRLRITTRGVVDANGFLGQVVPVKNVRSGRVVRGHVLDAKTVAVPATPAANGEEP